ncbi:MAG TPA: patatin-like protein [Thermoanaerobaculia bacterium]|nr:patatin-like protein [Thermoanaerobaculia bacterium]
MSRAKSLAVAGILVCALCPPARSWARQTEPVPVAEVSDLREEYRKDDAGLVREVRLGLVCYGGSSLAIYMHGNTKELFRLVQASKALEIDAKAPDQVLKNAVLSNERPAPGAAGQKLTGSTRQWYERLLEVWDTDPKKVRTRVIIDVIAGTSAGGINGVILAKALAHDLSVDDLTELWMTKASLSKLTNRYFGLFRILAGRAPVDGDALLGWLYDALVSMDVDPAAAGRRSLLPTGDRLDLFVTATDRYGYPQNLVVGDPDSAAEPRHRHVLHFTYPGVKRGCGPEVKDDHFCPYWTPALAFAARASSSIPGVFPPLGLPHALETIGAEPAGTLQNDIATDLFRNYQLQQPSRDNSYLEKTFFVDGGVLDNHPFDPAIAEILQRSQNQEVRRFLVYLQPDPGKLPVGASGKEPSLLPTIWAGLSGLPSGQPILDSLTDVAEHNVRLERLRDIVRAEEQEARDREREGGGGGDCSSPANLSVAERFACAVGVSPEEIDDRLATATVPEVAALRRKLEGVAREGANELANRSYVSVRVHSVLDQLVTVIASERACNYPEDSAHRALVRKIVEQWAMERELIGSPGKPGGDLQAQLAFLEEFDVGYLRRQLRFVVDWVNIQYEGDEDGRLPDAARRRQLDAVKTAASREIEELTSFVDGSSTELAGGLGTVKELFGGLNPWKDVGELNQSLDQQAAALVADPQKLAALDSLRSGLGSQLLQLQQKVRKESFEAFQELTAGWDSVDRREILVRYLGFPFWDRQIYPLLAFADIGEFDQVKVFRLSPDDATLLGGGPASQKLVGSKKAHFGAFLSRPGREGDYLWGRLDAAERMLKLLSLPSAGAKPLFTAILDEEEKAGQVRDSILAARRKQVATLP